MPMWLGVSHRSEYRKYASVALSWRIVASIRGCSGGARRTGLASRWRRMPGRRYRRRRLAEPAGEVDHLGETLLQAGVEQFRVAHGVGIDGNPHVADADVRDHHDHRRDAGDGPERV